MTCINIQIQPFPIEKLLQHFLLKTYIDSSTMDIRIIIVCVTCSTTILMLFYIYKSPAMQWTKNIFPIRSNISNGIRNLVKGFPGSSYDRPLLTIFTSFKDVHERDVIQNNTIINWSSFGKSILPVFFTNLSHPNQLINFALDQGWIGLPMQRTNSFGTPFLKDMYRKTTAFTRSHFYGFCNGDILFDKSLISTLNGILKYKDNLNHTVLVIGRRTNVKIKDVHKKFASNYYNLLSKLAYAHGELYRRDAEDFFFISNPGGFPWHVIKDVVIGRPAYDNYLIGQAVKEKVPVIDANNTLLAFHQTGADGVFAGAKNKDANYNRRVIGPYPYNSGTTKSAQYQTEYDLLENVYVKMRH